MALDLSFTELNDAPDGAQAGAPTCIILHGLFGTKRNWGMVAKPLARDFRILSADLRNHGDSPWDDLMTYEMMADDLARLIDRHAGGKAHVVGHSMGGKVGMTLALHHPEKVDKLVAVDIPPAPTGSGLVGYVRAMRALDLSKVTRRGDADEALSDAIPNDGERSFLVQNLSRVDGAFKWRINLAAIEPAMPDIEGFPDFDTPFDGPTLFLAGGDSRYVKPHHQVEMDRLFPNHELAFVDGAGHWVHAERPKETTEAIRNFLSA